MSEMKMSDVFTLPVTTKLKFTGDKSNELTPDVILIDEHYTLNGTECNAVELAINNHDRMVEEIAELKGSLKSLIGKGVDLLNVEDVSDEEDVASVHANFNDAIIKSEHLLAKLNKDGGE